MKTMTAGLPTHELAKCGQSPWLDYISRDLIHSGKLRSLVRETGILGVTSNPSIFEKAINQQGGGYDQDIRRLLKAGKRTFEIYDHLTQSDIREACDELMPVYKASGGEHGFVSLEVIPGLAYYEDETVLEAERLFRAVKRPNVMIKVPATPEGIPAVRRLIGKGINVNITLMFSLRHYREVAQAYIAGLQDYAKAGGDVSRVHSVASVFVSRIDSFIDKQLPLIAQDTADPARRARIEALIGKAAISNSRLIYEEFTRLFESAAFKKLKAKGAWVQKVLWGSTSAKNPAFSDLYYVENLVGPDTVNTMPQATLEALLDHGMIQPNTITENLAEAQAAVQELNELGFNLEAIGDQLQRDGARMFCESFDSLMHSLERKYIEHKRLKAPRSFAVRLDRQTAQSESLLETISEWEHRGVHERFFARDPIVWKEDPKHQAIINNRLGWLHAAEWMLGRLYELEELTIECAREGVRDVVLLGMGGSSLAPEVLFSICKPRKGRFPKLHIVDTTDPGSLRELEKRLNLKKTVFIVASKSGTTAETVSQFRYFHEQIKKKVAGRGKPAEILKKAGRQFLAITDEGSWLDSTSRQLAFRRTFVNPSDIGGRFSALSYFGMVPAALAGLPVREILHGAICYLHQAQEETSLNQNSAFLPGIVLGEWAQEGRNKVFFFLSPALASFGAWLEQLIAESTGKEEKGILPLTTGLPASPEQYGKDAAFVLIRMKGEKKPGWLPKWEKLKRAGNPFMEMEWGNPEQIGAEFLRWEIVTSMAGAVLGINPFDEPNVRESKEATARLLDKLRKTRRLADPAGTVRLQGRSAKKNGRAVKLKNELAQLTASLPERGYVAILAYLARNSVNEKKLNRICQKLQAVLGKPVLYGFGPRYLHSIGQLYKGGPRTGGFIQLLIEDRVDFKVPQAHFSFGALKKAQALGDLEAIVDKNLPVVVLQLGRNVDSAFAQLEQAVSKL